MKATFLYFLFFSITFMGLSSVENIGLIKQQICKIKKVRKPKKEWKKQLNDIQYHVTREAGTEVAFTGLYWDFKNKGLYTCIGCELPLFSSEAKFDSGTGWPSYWEPVDPCHVRLYDDFTLGIKRTEVVCARCNAHLGHVFDDGPPPTGKRFCMNSASLNFVSSQE